MKPIVGCLKYPEDYRRIRESLRTWAVYKVPKGRLTPTDEHQALGPLEAIFIGRFARFRSWIYVHFSDYRE